MHVDYERIIWISETGSMWSTYSKKWDGQDKPVTQQAFSKAQAAGWPVKIKVMVPGSIEVVPWNGAEQDA